MNIGAEILDNDEILRYLGYQGQELTESLKQQIERCKEAVCKSAQPKVIWKEFRIKEEMPVSEQISVLTGEDIARHVLGCDIIYLMAATLGSEVERLLMKTQVSNMADALIMDSCASTMIELICDRTEEELRENCRKSKRILTGRFSPGYGDLPISVQKEFTQILDTGRKIGLTVSGSGILIPRKSVTAVLGSYRQELKPDMPAQQEKGNKCKSCSLYETCSFRRGGSSCGK